MTTGTTARFVGGLYDGIDQSVLATPGFIAVGPCFMCFSTRQGHRCKDLRFVGNPSIGVMPPGWEMYRLESVSCDRMSATYVLPDIDLGPPAGRSTRVAVGGATTTRSTT